jgi:multimeric flavodoxin WrbA
MQPKILGISGSPIKNSNTDRLVQTVLNSSELTSEFVKLSKLKITGNTECLVCGFGSTCPMSSLPWVFGDDTTVTADKFCKVEDQSEVWEKAKLLGPQIAQKIKNRVLM